MGRVTNETVVECGGASLARVIGDPFDPADADPSVDRDRCLANGRGGPGWEASRIGEGRFEDSRADRG
jgi:hypothetical protein